MKIANFEKTVSRPVKSLIGLVYDINRSLSFDFEPNRRVLFEKSITVRTLRLGSKPKLKLLFRSYTSPIKLFTGRETVFSKLAIFIIHWKIKKSIFEKSITVRTLRLGSKSKLKLLFMSYTSPIKLFTGRETVFSKLAIFIIHWKIKKSIFEKSITVRTLRLGSKSKLKLIFRSYTSPIKLFTGRETVFSKLAIFIIHWKIKKSRTVILFSKIDFLIFQ